MRANALVRPRLPFRMRAALRALLRGPIVAIPECTCCIQTLAAEDRRTARMQWAACSGRDRKSDPDRRAGKSQYTAVL